MTIDLFQKALQAREKAFAPYSGFQVGAALLTESGRIYTGCNVENASFGLTICAERLAIFKAISDGEKRFSEIWIIADTQNLTPPCGACRQIIWEFCGDIRVVLANLQGHKKEHRMSELLPSPFHGGFIQEMERS